MQRIQLGKEFFISAFIALLFAVILLFIVTQTETTDRLCEAIESGNNEIAMQLSTELVNIDWIGSDNFTPLGKACAVGNKEMIVFLINSNADVNYAPDNQLTPLELFCHSGYMAGEDALNKMLKAWVKQSNYTNKPAIFYLAEQYQDMTNEEKAVATEITILLLKKGAPLGYENTTLLHMAAKGDMDDLFYTVSHSTQGLNLLTKEDQDGNTPWEVAVKCGSTKVQKVIRDLESELSGKPSDPLDSIVPGLDVDNDILGGSNHDEYTEPTTEPTNKENTLNP